MLQLSHVDAPRGRNDVCAARLGGDNDKLDAAEGTVGQYGHLGRDWARAGFGLGARLGVRVGVGFSRVGVGMGLGLLVRVGLDVSMATPSISRSARTASPFAIQQRVVPD